MTIIYVWEKLIYLIYSFKFLLKQLKSLEYIKKFIYYIFLYLYSL